MAGRRVDGEFAGYTSEGDNDPVETNTSMSWEANEEAGKAQTNFGGLVDEFTDPHSARLLGFLQRRLDQGKARQERRKRPVEMFFKDDSAVDDGLPEGMMICPECAKAVKDFADCLHCDGRGMVPRN